MILSTNGSNGRREPHTAPPPRLLSDARPLGRDDDTSIAYAAALIVAPLVEDDILDLVRRGFMVRPFLEIDATLAAFVLGQSREMTRPTTAVVHHDRGLSTEVAHDHTPDERPVPIPPERTYDGEFASHVCAQFDPMLPNGVIREFFHLSARKTKKRLSVAQAAEAIGIERTKLATLLHDAGFPTADVIIRYHLLMHAVWLLDRTPRRTAQEVAKALGFASGPSMSNTIKNTTGMSPTELIEHGGIKLMFAQLRRELQGSKPADARAEAVVAG